MNQPPELLQMSQHEMILPGERCGGHWKLPSGVSYKKKHIVSTETFQKTKLHLAISNIGVGSSLKSQFPYILGVIPIFISWSLSHWENNPVPPTFMYT